jgi:serine/alanine adding enzyme
MDIKTIVADVAAACAQRWSDSADANQQEVAIKLVARLNELKTELKQKKTEKQECARDFGAIKTAGGDLSSQKALMQQISSAIEHIEHQRKAIEGELVELFAPDDSDEASELSQPVRSTHSASLEIAVEIIEISDSDAALWDAYVEAHPKASQYHLYGWRAVIARSFKHSSIYLAARDHDGRLRGILPLIRLRSRLFGDFAVSMPFFNYGGPLSDNQTIAQKLLQSAATYAQQLGLSHLEIRATSTLNDWPTRTDKVSMVLTLPESEEHLDADLGSKVRAQIKRAQHEETRVAIGHIDLLDDFYHVFAINMRDLGTPVYSKKFFRNILQERGNQAHIVIVNWRNKPVGAASCWVIAT